MNDESLKVREINKGFRPPFMYFGFLEYYCKCGFTRLDVSQLTKKSIKTVKRWESSDAPKEIYMLLYACAGYVLCEAYYGFRFSEGLLYTGTRITYNYGFTASSIIEYSFFKDYVYTLESSNKALKQQLGNTLTAKRSIND